MNWTDKCVLELTHLNLFESEGHRQRFRDLLSCYYPMAFFTKGLCKCMYVSSWDEEHFLVILEILNGMMLDNAKNLNLMKDQGEMLEQQVETNFDTEVYRLSNAFLNDSRYDIPDLGIFDAEGAHIIRQSLKAAQCIDDLPEVHSEA